MATLASGNDSCLIREDLYCTFAKLQYGTTLRSPSEFFSPSSQYNKVDSVKYVCSAKKSMIHTLQATPPQITTLGRAHV